MSNYIVDGADLTSVANAIRTKGGTSAQLAFPADFVQAIEDIETGGGGDYTAVDFLNAANPTGAISSSDVTSVGSHRMYQRTGITSLDLPNCTSVSANAFQGCSGITSINLPELTTTGDSSFNACSNITAVYLPKLKTAAVNLFRNCTKLRTVVLPSCTAFGGAGYQFYGGVPVTRIDVGGATLSIVANTFAGATALKTLVIRATTAATLANINAFLSTPFASGKSGGTLYVPQAKIADYQAATNWSTILGYANNKIKSIESTHTDPDAPIDLTLYYVDGTPIPTT